MGWRLAVVMVYNDLEPVGLLKEKTAGCSPRTSVVRIPKFQYLILVMGVLLLKTRLNRFVSLL
jgi:hypothetical protein